MNILITGTSGFVGSHVYRKLQDRYAVFGLDKNRGECTRYEIELTDKKQVEKVMHEVNPSIVIHAAALPNVEYCETHRDEAHAINVGGTRNLVESISGSNTLFIYLSSDYVYDGVKGNFTEEDLPHPISWYGQNKLDSERIVQQLPRHLILRPTVIFGWDPGGKNFFMQLFENKKAKREMRVPIDQVSNPTYVELLAQLIDKSIEKNLTGTFIATGPETIGRYDFGRKICDVFGWDAGLLTPVTTKDLGQIAKRPLNCGTDSGKIQKALGVTFPSLNESLTHLLSVVSYEE